MSPHPSDGLGHIPDGADPEAYDRLRRRILWAMPTGLFVIGSRGPRPATADPNPATATADPNPADPNPATAIAAATADPTTPANLMTANLVVQVATDPKMLAIALEATSRTAELVQSGGTFSVSLLDRADRALVRKFVKPVAEIVTDDAGRLVSMAGVEVIEAPSGTPVLAQALAWVDCEVRHQLPLGSHRLVVGEVMAAAERPQGLGEAPGILRMEDTRMNYGG